MYAKPRIFQYSALKPEQRQNYLLTRQNTIYLFHIIYQFARFLNLSDKLNAYYNVSTKQYIIRKYWKLRK